MTRASEYFLKIVCCLYAAIPYLVLCIWCVYAMMMRMEIGHWPLVYEDNLHPSFVVLDKIAGVSLLVFLLSIPQLVVILLLRYWQSLTQTCSTCSLIFCAGAVLFVFLCFVTPLGSFITWFLD